MGNIGQVNGEGLGDKEERRNGKKVRRVEIYLFGIGVKIRIRGSCGSRERDVAGIEWGKEDRGKGWRMKEGV